MERYVALVAALVFLFVSNTATAQEEPRTDYPSGFVISDNTPCFAQVGDAEPWAILAAHTDVLVYTDPSEPWIMIGVYPDPKTGSRNSCWTESWGVSPGIGEIPTEEPSPESTAQPVTPEVIPPVETEPTEALETPAVAVATTADPTAESATETTSYVTELPSTGSRTPAVVSDDSWEGFLGQLLGHLLLLVVAAAVCVIGALIARYFEYKNDKRYIHHVRRRP